MSTVALTTVFSTSLSTALTPKTSVVESLITFHTTTAQITVNEGSGRTQTDVNDLFNKVLTQTVVFQETQVFTTVFPIQTLFSTITSPTANVAAATTATRTILTTTAASPSTFSSSSSSSSANAATSSPEAAASSAPTGTVAKEAAFQESSASDQAGGSSSTATARAQTTNSLPSSVPTNNSLTASSNTSDGTGSNSSSDPNGARTGAIVAAVLIVLLLLGFVAAGIWWFRRRRRSRKGGLTSGWMSQERTFTSLEDPDEKVAGRWMSGYGFGRGSTVGPTTWPEKSFIGKRRSSSLVPHIPTLSPVATPPLALPLPLEKSHNPFNDPLPPTKPVDAAASLPPSTLKKSNSIPRKTVPPVSPLHPFAPNPSKSTNREYFGPGGRHPIFAQLGMGSGGGGGIPATSDASLPDSNTSGSSLDDRHLSLTSTDRSSMSSNLQFHSSFTDSITIFHQIPSPEVSPTDTRAPPGPLRFDDIGPTTPNPFEDQPPIARIPRPRIPSITLTMATGSMYSSTTTVPSPSGTEDPFASRRDSLALTEEGETDSIRSSKSSSELPALFTTAESLAEEEERESPKSSSSPTPPSSSNFFPSPSTSSSSSSHSIKHPHHHHLPHQRPPPIQSSRLGASKPSSSSSSSDDSAQPPSPSFPYISKTSFPTSPTTPSTAHDIRMVLQNDQRATSLYRDALEKRKTLAESVISNDSLDQLGSLLGHGEEGKRNGKWPRPPGEE